jgi:hypothetical protein
MSTTCKERKRWSTPTLSSAALKRTVTSRAAFLVVGMCCDVQDEKSPLLAKSARSGAPGFIISGAPVFIISGMSTTCKERKRWSTPTLSSPALKRTVTSRAAFLVVGMCCDVQDEKSPLLAKSARSGAPVFIISGMSTTCKERKRWSTPTLSSGQASPSLCSGFGGTDEGVRPDTNKIPTFDFIAWLR